jgi:C4-dicarboxylate-specific signal transduction histidine kinase
VRITKSVPADLPKLRADENRLNRALTAVVENAVLACPEGGRVDIQVEEVWEDGRGWIACQVRDNGAGFKPEEIPGLFEPFATNFRGRHGLGLSIVQRIVYDHGGKLTAANRSEGGGVVTLKLPAGRE